jgi:hypothetical protein
MFEIYVLGFVFFLLTPGILWSYAKKTNKYSIALLHAGVFAFVWYLIHTPIKEGLTENDKVIFEYTTNLYTTENRKKAKMFKQVSSTKNNDKAKIKVIFNGKENGLTITQRDFDDDFTRALKKLKNLKEFKK